MTSSIDLDQTLSLGPLAAPARAAVGAVPVIGFAERYQLGARLAEGGLAIIYDAHDVVLDRRVAIKQLRDPDPGLAARFLREARLTSRLVHPGIVPVYDLGTAADGVLSYAMKWIAGQSLAQAIAACATLDQRLALIPAVIAIAEAVAYAHSQRVIHRDLKPANVVVGAFGEIVVIDWGLARTLDEVDEVDAPAGDRAPAADPRLTSAGSVLGTPCYMPPEQARGEHVDTRADIYALGAILYHLVAGTAPYDVSGAHTADSGDPIWDRVAAGPPPAITTLVPAVPPELATVIERAMARAPAERFADAEAVASALTAFRAHDHSARLTAAATARVVEVEAGVVAVASDDAPAIAAVTATADVARFGLEQALAAWPANPDARRALERLRRALFELARARGDLATAAALAAELPDDAERRQAVAALAARAAATAALVRDRDHRVGLRERTLITAGFAVLVIAAFLQTVLAGVALGDPLPQRTLLINGGVVVAVVAAVVLAARQRLFANAASSGATRTLIAAALAGMVNRGIGYLDDIPSAHVLRIDLLILVTALVAYGRWRIALLPLAALAASLLWPITARVDFNLGLLATALAILVRWRQQSHASIA